MLLSIPTIHKQDALCVYDEWRDETDEFFDHLSDEEWIEKYGYSCEKARCFGWYMEDQVVRIDEEGNVFVKCPGNNYTDYKRGNTIKDHRWFHSIISRPRLTKSPRNSTTTTASLGVMSVCPATLRVQ